MHWRLRLTDLAVRWRFKRHAERPLDVAWARERIGRPLWVRRLITPPIERSVVALRHGRAEALLPPRGELPPERALLYVHGGGYIACSPSTHRPLSARLAREWRSAVVVPDYRLAPEHPFPAALHDVLDTWRWMLETLPLEPAQVAFVGDSAGGGLALSTALACAAAGLPRPAAVVAFSPWTDLTCAGDSLAENAERCAMFVPAQLEAAARLYAGDTPRSDPAVSPLQGALETLPPVCLHASHDELLRDDTLRFAERARRAGVEVSCRVWPHVPHGWQFLAGLLPEARESLDAAAAFVRHHVPASDVESVRQRLAEVVTQHTVDARETYVPQA